VKSEHCDEELIVTEVADFGETQFNPRLRKIPNNPESDYTETPPLNFKRNNE
jgi:hypothetical protein